MKIPYSRVGPVEVAAPEFKTVEADDLQTLVGCKKKFGCGVDESRYETLRDRNILEFEIVQ